MSAADPGLGTTLDATPEAVRLSFSEQPEAALSEIHVLDSEGTAEQVGEPKAAGGDPLTLEIPVRPLSRGVYTVSWKVISAVDGHAADGTYAFGVGVTPKGAATTTSATTPSISRFELAARWVLLLGVVALLGGAAAMAARFGGSSGSDLRLAAAGWAASVVGLLLLADAQRITADSSLGQLLDTSVGKALIWRALALVAAGAALLLAWRVPRVRRGASALAVVATLVAIVLHVAAGHAAAGNWSSALTVAAQTAHFAAAGIWAGGLAALLLGIRGAPSAAKAIAVRRFAALALTALVVLVLTGTLRAVDELSSWSDLFASGYGRAVLAKVVLILLVIGLAARNRGRNVPGASRDLGPLRRTSKAELGLAVVALGVAALLGTLAPPVSGLSAPPGLSASGSDFGTTTRVELSAGSAKPGPNRFTVRVEDYDSGDPLKAQVELRFTPLDDPGVASSTLKLEPGPDDSYVGSGANLAFDGRWGVDAIVQRGDDAIEVPLELDLPGPKQFVSVLRIPGRPPKYTMTIGLLGDVRIEPKPERAGPSRIYVTCYTPFGSIAPIDRLVLTTGSPENPTRQRAVQRLGGGRFAADVDLEAGPFEVTVVAYTSYGERLRAPFELKIPAD